MKKRIAAILLNPVEVARTRVSVLQISSIVGTHTDGRTLVMRRLPYPVSKETGQTLEAVNRL